MSALARCGFPMLSLDAADAVQRTVLVLNPIGAIRIGAPSSVDDELVLVFAGNQIKGEPVGAVLVQQATQPTAASGLGLEAETAVQFD